MCKSETFHNKVVFHDKGIPRQTLAWKTLRVGQTFTIEPMLTIGKTADAMWKDGWTAVTKDGKWTAQCEHTLLITDDGVEILTASPMKKTERFPAKEATAA